MNTNELNRTVQALIETKTMLNKELAYKPEFQKKESIDFYNSHIAKLEKMLSDSWVEIAA